MSINNEDLRDLTSRVITLNLITTYRIIACLMVEYVIRILGLAIDHGS